MISAQKVRERQEKLHKANEEEINRKVAEQLSILESIIDKSIQKDNQTCITIKLDLHTRTVKKLEELGFTVNFNSTTDEFTISWSCENARKSDIQSEKTITKDLNRQYPKYERPKSYKSEDDRKDKICYTPSDREVVDKILKFMGFGA